MATFKKATFISLRFKSGTLNITRGTAYTDSTNQNIDNAATWDGPDVDTGIPEYQVTLDLRLNPREPLARDLNNHLNKVDSDGFTVVIKDELNEIVFTGCQLSNRERARNAGERGTMSLEFFSQSRDEATA